MLESFTQNQFSHQDGIDSWTPSNRELTIELHVSYLSTESRVVTGMQLQSESSHFFKKQQPVHQQKDTMAEVNWFNGDLEKITSYYITAGLM